MKKTNKETIEISKGWLEELLKLAKEAETSAEEKQIYNVKISCLIGYAKSADYILNK